MKFTGNSISNLHVKMPVSSMPGVGRSHGPGWGAGTLHAPLQWDLEALMGRVPCLLILGHLSSQLALYLVLYSKGSGPICISIAA